MNNWSSEVANYLWDCDDDECTAKTPCKCCKHRLEEENEQAEISAEIAATDKETIN